MRGSKGVIVVLVVSLVISTGAFIASIIAAASAASSNTRAIQRSAYIDCELIRGILYSFATKRGRAAANQIIAANPHLQNCAAYALTFH